MQDKHEKTSARTAELRKNGSTVEEAWECQSGQLLGFPEPKEQTQSYPFAIFFDFESYGDVNERKIQPKCCLLKANTSPSLSALEDTLNREPTHLCNKDPKKLIFSFRNELLVRHLAITAEARKRFLGDSPDYVNKKQAKLMLEWCNNVPVLGFNSGRYDLNLIKEHFVSSLAEIKNNKINLAKNGNKIMFLRTKRFRFLDVVNYVGPGTSYDKSVRLRTGKILVPVRMVRFS